MEGIYLYLYRSNGLSHIPLPSVRDVAVLCCNFIVIRLLLFGTALSIREEFYFVVLLV